MQRIENVHLEGERPLYALTDAEVFDSVIGTGESSLKHCRNLDMRRMRFEGKYPLWHSENITVRDSVFAPGARAAVWYVKDIRYEDCVIDAPKMFRDGEKITLVRTRLSDALETFWHTKDVHLDDVDVVHGDYLFMHSENIRIENYRHDGNYAFQYCKNIEIRNAHIKSRDAFWNSENITVRDSVIESEFLAWHSHNLHLINCTISGPQPLCYAHDLVMENCVMAEDSTLAFEYTTLNVDVRGTIPCVKNPNGGRIAADAIDEIIFDQYAKVPRDKTEIVIKGSKSS